MKEQELTTLIIVGGVVIGVALLTQGGQSAIQQGTDNITAPLGQGAEVLEIIGGIGLLVFLLPVGA